MTEHEQKMQRVHELICSMDLDAVTLARELREKFGWGLTPRQVSLFVGGLFEGVDLDIFLMRLEKIIQMRREDLVHSHAKTMSDVIRVWKKKLEAAGLDHKVTSITLIMEAGGVAAGEFGEYLARDEKPNQQLLNQMSRAIEAATALAARVVHNKSIH